jgi:uncharacterized protein YdeI (YjbR/CyaY-like superfamily)
MVKPTFFRDASAFRRWLAKHGATKTELTVGFHRKATGKPSITYPEALDEALCVGWIDGIRKKWDESSYTVRFTPRRPKSNWSLVNIARVKVLAAAGRMQPSGLEAFARRDETKTYAHANHPRTFDAASERALRADPRAWAFFQTQSTWMRGGMAHWVTSAKREETRARRLASLIEHLREGTIPPALVPPGRKAPGGR